jgi:hypothetical protein
VDVPSEGEESNIRERSFSEKGRPTRIKRSATENKRATNSGEFPLTG